MEVIDSSNPYSLDNFNDFNNNTLNDFYISNSLFNGYSSIVFNNSTTLTVKSEAISINCIIFPANKGYAREVSINLVLDSNCVYQLKHY